MRVCTDIRASNKATPRFASVLEQRRSRHHNRTHRTRSRRCTDRKIRFQGDGLPLPRLEVLGVCIICDAQQRRSIRLRLLPTEDSQRWLQVRHCKSSAIHLSTICSRLGLDVCRLVVLRPLQDSWACHDLQQRSVHHWTDYDGLVHQHWYQIRWRLHRRHGHLCERAYQLRLPTQQYRRPVEASSLSGNDGHWRCIRRHHFWEYLSRRRCPTLRSSAYCVYMFPGTSLDPGRDRVGLISELLLTFVQIIAILLVTKNFFYYTYCNREADRGEMIIEGQPGFRFTL